MTLRLTAAEAKRLLGKKLPAATTGPLPAAARRNKRPISPAQDALWDKLSACFPGAVANYRPIEGRRYSVDIAWPDSLVAVEVDGWAFHGRFKADFHRDRAKRNLLALQGWTLLAIPARDVWRDPEGVTGMVRSALESRRRQSTSCALE